MAESTARLLNTQAMNLDVLDVCLLRFSSALNFVLTEPYHINAHSTTSRHVLSSPSSVQVITDVPPAWPLHVLSSFLSRSFRRTLHAHHEAQLVKALAASENLAVAEASWVVLREAGSIVEEEEDSAATEDEDEVFEKEKVMGEVHAEGGALRLSLDEKAGLRGSATHLVPGAELRGYDVSDRDGGGVD